MANCRSIAGEAPFVAGIESRINFCNVDDLHRGDESALIGVPSIRPVVYFGYVSTNVCCGSLRRRLCELVFSQRSRESGVQK